MHRAGAETQAATDVARWTTDAFSLLTELPAVRRVGLALVEGGGRRLRFTASDRTGGPDVDWCDVDGYDDVPLNTAARTATPVIGSLAELGDRFPGYVSRQDGTEIVALAAVPIVAGGQALGGYLLLFDQPQAFDRRQRLALSRMGSELGAALRRARSVDRSRPKLPNGPPPAGAQVASHEVEGDPAAVAGARQFLRQVLYQWEVDVEVVDNAVLCLSELVTNALIHSHSGCLVRVVLEQGVLTTTILYGGIAHAASVTEVADPLQVHGRGLQVVSALAARWGHDLHTDGSTGWFELDLEPRR